MGQLNYTTADLNARLARVPTPKQAASLVHVPDNTTEALSEKASVGSVQGVLQYASQLEARIAALESQSPGPSSDPTVIAHGGAADVARPSGGIKTWHGYVVPTNAEPGDVLEIIPPLSPAGIVVTVDDGVAVIEFTHRKGVAKVQTWRYAEPTAPDELGAFTGEINYADLTVVTSTRRALTAPVDEDNPYFRLRFVPAPVGSDTVAVASKRYASPPSAELVITES